MEYIKLIRPKHYIKNLIIFLPLFFSGEFFLNNNLIYSILAFVCFSFVASSIYILNDIMDKDKDKKHPTKRNRPIASGKVSVKNAITLIAILLICTLFIICFIAMPLLSIIFLGLYLIINIAYSFGLKNFPIVDIAIVVCGFVIRILYGASLFDIEVSNWLYLTVLAISFYLALGKRRGEIVKSGEESRNVLKFYNKEFLDKNMYMFLAMAIVFYCLWATDSALVIRNNNLLILTIPVVILICLKYSLVIEGDCDGDPVNVILKDKFLILMTIILVLMLFVILYF